MLELLLSRYTSIPLDVGRMRANQPLLDAYRIDTFLDKPTSVWEWVQRALLPLLPVRPMQSEDGLYFQPFTYSGDGSKVVLHLDADDQEVSRASSVSARYDTFNEFAISAGKWKDGYAITRSLTGDPEADRLRRHGQATDERNMGDYRCEVSRARFGRLVAPPIETACLWDVPTVFRVMRDMALKHALPVLGVQYVAPSELLADGIYPGSYIALTDSDLFLSGRVCLVEDISYSVDELVLELSILPDV